MSRDGVQPAPVTDPAEGAAAVRREFAGTPLAGELLGLARARRSPLCLAGGFVRDALQGGAAARDLDFAVAADPEGWARAWAGLIGGSPVPLDPERGTWRVAAKIAGRLWHWDFTLLRGPDIEADLAARDFTVNAIGLTLWPEASELLDPTGGLGDLAARLIRLTHPGALDDDPVRRLRAYRFAAQLGFAVEPGTEAGLGGTDLTPLVSGERVREELAALLACPASRAVMDKVAAAGLLRSLWPQGGPALEGLGRLEDFLSNGGRAPLPPPAADLLAEPSTHDLPHIIILKMASLFPPGGGSAGAAEAAARAARYLVLGRKAAAFLISSLRAAAELANRPFDDGSPRHPWEFFDAYGTGGLGGLLLQAALRPGEPSAELLGRLSGFYRDDYLPDLARPPLLSGEEVMRLGGPGESPELGRLMAEIRTARRLGILSTPGEAETFVRSRVSPSKP